MKMVRDEFTLRCGLAIGRLQTQFPESKTLWIFATRDGTIETSYTEPTLYPIRLQLTCGLWSVDLLRETISTLWEAYRR